jgi:hypothetical protein
LEEEHFIFRLQVEAEHGKSGTDVEKGRVRTVALSKPVGLRRNNRIWGP